MKRRYLYLVIISLVVLTLLIPFVLQAQRPDDKIPPPPPMPWELPQNRESNSEFSLKHKATPTPNSIEAESLIWEEAPQKKPSLEIVDTSLDVPRENKYLIIIERGPNKKRIGIAVPLSIKPEEAIQKFLQTDDEFLYISMPLSPRGKLFEEGK